MPAKNYVAVDLGAESGRVMLGALDGKQLTLTEVHRFPHGPVKQGESLRWDFAAMAAEVRRGLAAAVAQGGADLAGLSVNSWGVDFGLLDRSGALLENPYHYRDSRTDGMLEAAFCRMPQRQIYEHTGIQFMQLNTLYQLLAMRVRNDPALDRAHTLVFMADLIAHALSGEVFGEYTLASTSQLLNMKTRQWSAEVMRAMDLPAGILPKVVAPGTVVGRLRADVARAAGAGAVPVIAAASHDTADAVAAVPAAAGTAGWAYLSSGTWSLIGVEISEPVITDESFRCSLTNEGGVDGTIRLLKNIMGLWLVQECRRQWQREGQEYSYAELAALAAQARPFAAAIDPGDSAFIAPGDMPARINAHLARTGQKPLTDRGEIVRSVLESLAFNYRQALDRIETLTGRKIAVLHIVGGGSQNELLNQFAANATGREVVTGPVEATSIGNVLIQARATGQLRSLADIREIVRSSFPTKRYRPKEAEAWAAQERKRASLSAKAPGA